MTCKNQGNEYSLSPKPMGELMRAIQVKNLDQTDVDALIERVEQARSYDLSLEKSDLTLLLESLRAYLFLQEKLEANDLTIHKLKKLLGMISSSEKNRKDAPDNKSKNDSSEEKSLTSSPQKKGKKKNLKKGKRKSEDFSEAEKIVHPVLALKKGDSCPECLVGKVYKYEPSLLIRITGHSPYEPKIHIRERLRCNTCGELFSAKLPSEVLEDGSSNQRYGYSARSLMAINKYLAGSPFKRQESLQKVLNTEISASTIFDQCKYLAQTGIFIQKELQLAASRLDNFYVDDTTHRLLEKKPFISSKTGKERSGVYTSGLIAQNTKGLSIVLFKTNIGHSGEHLDEVLKYRDEELPTPLVMSDALSSNIAGSIKYHQTLCNVHGRRKFEELKNNEPKVVGKILDWYSLIYENEEETIEMGLSERLEYHKKHSLPIMNDISNYTESLISDKLFEPNSNMGKAVSYFHNHWNGLIGFCKYEGAPLDNNLMERTLRLIVLGRKNFYFYRTQEGANISDIITSILATCKANDVNPFIYLNTIQKNHNAVQQKPGDWLPWNYKNNLN